jgi:hypothetical protein
VRFKWFIKELVKQNVEFKLRHDQMRSLHGLDPVEELAKRKGFKIDKSAVNRFAECADYLELPVDVRQDLCRAVDYEDLRNFPRAERYRRVLRKYLKL